MRTGQYKMVPLNQLLTEYVERNTDSTYKAVAVGKYGIRTRESIYSKELTTDYSKYKVIYQDTLTVGMGSKQIDIGILSDNQTYCVSPAYHTYRIDGIDSNYLNYCLQQKNSEMFERFVRRGSRQGKTIEFKRWINYQIPVYSLEDQCAIVARLSKVEKIISNYQKEISLMDSLIKSRFVEMFDDYDECVKLSDVALVTGGLTKNSKRKNLPMKLPYLRVANVAYNKIDLSEVLEIGLTDEEKDKTLLQSGDLLFVEGNGSPEQIGRVAVWRNDLPTCVHQNHLIKARFNKPDVLPDFALYYFMTEKGRQQIKRKAVSTSGLYTLSVQKVADFLLPKPPVIRQKDFVNYVAQIDKSKLAQVIYRL